jgi:hypothetical protein
VKLTLGDAVGRKEDLVGLREPDGAPRRGCVVRSASCVGSDDGSVVSAE